MDDLNAQLEALAGKLNPDAIQEREVGGGFKADYLEGWYVIDTMNRIFGFNKWSGYIQEIELTTEGQAYCVYKVAVTFADGSTRESTGVGHGSSKLTDKGRANDNALKEAETDAMKRACRYLGNKLGNALYDPKKRGVGK